MPVTTGITTVAMGSNSQLSCIVQAAAGAIDATPAWVVIPFSSAEITVNAAQLNDDSMTGDRSELEPRSGTVNATISVSGKFRPESFDAIIEAAAQGTWAVKYTEALGAGVTVVVSAAGKTFTRSAGSWLTTGVEVGDFVAFSGFTETGPPDETPNNDTFEVTTVDALVITCANATTLVATAAPQASVTITTAADYVKVGSTQRRVAWELYHSDVDEYVRIRDTEIASFVISLATNGDVTFQLEAIGGTELDLGAAVDTAIAGATYTETTKPFYDSFTGSVSLEGVSGIYFSSINPSINNQSTPLIALGSRYPFAVAHGKMMGNMNITAFYTDETIKSKYQDQTSLDLKIQIKYKDTPGEALIAADFHEFDYPNCKIISFSRPVGSMMELSDNLEVKPYKNTALDSSFRIRKYVAV